MSKKIVIICGPTAVGKTGLGVKVCKEFDGEIVSADSQQVYRGMNIGTAKENLTGQGVKCHLVDVIDPDEPFDVSKFKELANEAITDIVKRGKLPVVVGGTGFYIRTLLEGLSEAPGRSEEIRNELLKLKEKGGAGALYKLLEDEDPVMAERLNIADYVRVIRALEVKRLTGRSLAEFNREHQRAGAGDSPVAGLLRNGGKALKIGLNMDRTELYENIDRRVDSMIGNGLIEEVKGLVEKYGAEVQSLKAVGYKEIVQYINGDCDLKEAIRLTKRNTRRFAKRQLTWFRADPEIEWFTPLSPELFSRQGPFHRSLSAA